MNEIEINGNVFVVNNINQKIADKYKLYAIRYFKDLLRKNSRDYPNFDDTITNLNLQIDSGEADLDGQLFYKSLLKSDNVAFLIDLLMQDNKQNCFLPELNKWVKDNRQVADEFLMKVINESVVVFKTPLGNVDEKKVDGGEVKKEN